jgi:hypothetical protein
MTRFLPAWIFSVSVLGNIRDERYEIFFFFWDSKFVQISNWVVQWFGMLDPNTLRRLII